MISRSSRAFRPLLERLEDRFAPATDKLPVLLVPPTLAADNSALAAPPEIAVGARLGFVSGDLSGTTVFSSTNWLVLGTAAPAGTLGTLVRSNGQFQGYFAELNVFQLNSPGIFQAWSLTTDSGLRPILPSSATTLAATDGGYTLFTTPTIWVNSGKMIQNMNLTDLNIQQVGANLVFAGSASNPYLRTSNYTLNLAPADANGNNMQASVSYPLLAQVKFALDPKHFAKRETFQIARFTTRFLRKVDFGPASFNDYYNDFVKLKRRSTGFYERIPLKNSIGYLLSNPSAFDGTKITLGRTTPKVFPATQIPVRPSGTLIIRKPDGIISPQGKLRGTVDGAVDKNIDVWANWDSAPANYARNQLITRISFVLRVRGETP